MPRVHQLTKPSPSALNPGALTHLQPADRDQQIVVLCDRAIGELNEARTLEDVLGIRNVAEAFRTYTRKMKAAVEAQSAVQTIVLLAEAKIGAELKAAQDRGEVATQEGGRPVSARPSGTSPATLSDLGITSQRASEYKKLAEAGEEVIRKEVALATSEGRVATRQGIIDAMRPIAAAGAQQFTNLQRQQSAPTAPRSSPAVVVEAVEPVGPEWNDWTGAVQVLATLRADLPKMASAITGLNASLLGEAQQALPRLQAWIVELEAAHV